MDQNKNGVISFEEFETFWKVVKGAGHGEAEIELELDNIKNGESWAGFQNLPKQYMPSNSTHNAPH